MALRDDILMLRQQGKADDTIRRALQLRRDQAMALGLECAPVLTRLQEEHDRARSLRRRQAREKRAAQLQENKKYRPRPDLIPNEATRAEQDILRHVALEMNLPSSGFWVSRDPASTETRRIYVAALREFGFSECRLNELFGVGAQLFAVAGAVLSANRATIRQMVADFEIKKG